MGVLANEAARMVKGFWGLQLPDIQTPLLRMIGAPSFFGLIVQKIRGQGARKSVFGRNAFGVAKRLPIVLSTI